MSDIKNLSSNKGNEKEIINIMKEVCRVPNLKPEDWYTYGPKVNIF